MSPYSAPGGQPGEQPVGPPAVAGYAQPPGSVATAPPEVEAVPSDSPTAVPLTAEHPVARVDLLPPEVLARRRFARVRIGLGAGVAATVLACVGATVWAAADAGSAEGELSREQARTVDLETEASQYNAVPALINAVGRAEAALGAVMATDIAWYEYLFEMSLVAPETVWFETVTMTAVPAGQPPTDPLAPTDGIGAVTVSGAALTHPDVSAWLDEMNRVSAYEHVLVSESTVSPDSETEPFVTFVSSAVVGPEALSNRYTDSEQ